MPQPFSSQLDLKLLNLVKNNPVLYNPRHPKYSDSDTREVTWQKISDALSKPTAEFAGIQCHIQFGDYNEEKHKPGFIENLNEYLPEQYCSSWGIEKKILKEFSSHVGLNELEAKHLYTKTARALPTYGVTFFLVKEKQKGKKKLVPRLLGINAEAILRLDECTKEILQQWPLTHVKTYHAGKGETFTLNFGDYVDKEYSVKTRDAFRIRDILEGYIDLIRKRMLANYNQSQSETGYISMDNISSGQSSMVQHITNSPMKIVEQTYVGPSKIVQYEPGQTLSQGAETGTVQQMVISELINKQGQGVKGEVPLKKDMGIPFYRRLNRLNSSSVKIVTLLTEPSQAHIEEAKNIVDDMNAHMPFVKDGVKETVANQSSAEEKKKLQDQLHELDELLKLLSQNTEPSAVNPSEAEDAAKQIADLTTQMYFAIAPEPKRRSRILSKSRNSFIADERTENNLRRASFIAATASANHALDNARELLDEEYKGPPLTAEQVEELEKSAVDKLGKINAGIAHYLLAHSDPHNIDYATAVNSLNTVNELTPELAKDMQALASTRDGAARNELLGAGAELCAAARSACAMSGVEDTEKLQEASVKYADVAGKLVYLFGRGSKARAEKENEIVDLAKEVGAKTSELLMSAQALTEMAASEPAAEQLDAAGAATASVAKDLLAQAELNAPTIHEPHCQSALTAASEALSSSAQQLAATWRPLVEDPARHEIGEKLHNRTMDLARALDRLRQAYGNLGDLEEDSETPKSEGEAQRLKFIMSLSRLGGRMQDAEDDLNKPLTSGVKEAEAKEAEMRLAQRLAQLSAALAALQAAAADRSNPDYATADSAVATINELMPELVKDSKIATANKDEASKVALLDNIKDLCVASKNVCASAYDAEPEDASNAVAQYTGAARQLAYVLDRRAVPETNSQIIEHASGACKQAGVLGAGARQLAGAVGGVKGAALEERSAALEGAAQALLTTAQLTSPSISDPRCQSILLADVDKVSGCGGALAEAWAPQVKDSNHEMRVLALKGALKQLETQLDKLRAACQMPEQEEQSTQECQLTGSKDIEDGSRPQQQQNLKFIMTMNEAKAKLAEAQKELDKPTMLAKGEDVDKVQHRLSQGLAQLNAAIAALLAATADRDNPNYAAAEQAANTITELMPQVIQDTKTVSAAKDEPTRVAMLAQIKEICEANEGICTNSGGNNPLVLNDAVVKLTNASGKLVYVVSPRVNQRKEQEIINLSSAACGATSGLLSGVQQLAESVGGAGGQELDARGVRVAEAAEVLLQTAQLTAPSLSSPQCQQALLSSVDSLSGAGKRLDASLAPLHADPKHKQQAYALQQALQQLDVPLEALRKACKSPVTDVEDLRDPLQNQQKLQFIKTMQGAKRRLGDAQKELNKPTMPAKGADVVKVQHRLLQGLAQLNAAIADLLAATADCEQPDYAVAEKAASTVTNLMPHVIQDTKTVSTGKDEPQRAAMLAQIKELCEASEGICASFDGSNPQGLNDAVAKLSNASGKLVYVVSPRVNRQRDEKIINLSSAACGATSGLLSGVQQLAESVGGAGGQELDARGVRVADAAQALLQTAQLTAPSLSSPQCQQALLSSVSSLSCAGQQLEASLAPLHADPEHKQQAHALQQALQQLDVPLDALRKACKSPDVEDLRDPLQNQQKLQFIKTMQGAKGRLGDAQKELNKPTMPAKGADVNKVQHRLSQGLAQLNAAIADLLAATADCEQPDYAAAEKAASTVTNLMPHVIQDTKTVSTGKDEPQRAAMLAQIKELCEASEGICASFDGSNPQGLNDAVAKLSNASGKLVYVVSPRVNRQRDEKIINLSSAVCGATSGLLSGVQQLAESVGGAGGQELDERGVRVADAAQALLQTAQLTAPSLSSPQCQQALLSSVDSLSGAGQRLDASLAPLHADPKHKQQAHALQQTLQQLDVPLDALRKACKSPDVEDLRDPLQNQQKLQFIKTIQEAKGRLEDAQKELNKPITPATGADVDIAQRRLSERLAQLNAAVAALLVATADRDKPDYVAAQKAATMITDLTPQVIQDTKTVSASKDEPTLAATLVKIKEICEASKGICAGFDGSNPQGLNDAVAKYSDASGKLVYAVSTKVNPRREKKIIALSSAICGTTSSLLSGVQQLTGGVGSTASQELDARGGRVADAAQALLQTAQITAPSMSSPECQETMLSSVDNLAGSGQQLTASLTPLQGDKQSKQTAHNVLQALQQLDEQLDHLRKSCKEPDSQDPHQERQKQQFIKTLHEVNEKWANAQKELRKPTTPARGADVDNIQLRLSQRLGELNAAIAALLSATADRDKPRYAEAELLVNTISNLLPQVIQDTKTVSAIKDEPTRVTMLSQIKEICKASEGICASSGGSNPQGLNDAVAKFTDASGKLVYVVNPRANPQKEEEILNLSSAACGATSSLLSGVQQLAESVGGAGGQELDARGGRVADAAQVLLQTAQITAPSMSSLQCQEALISSVDSLSVTGQQLASSLGDLHEDSKHSQQVRQLNQALQQLQAQLDALIKACRTHDSAPQSAPKKPPPPLPTTMPPTAAPTGAPHTVAHAVQKRSSTDVTQDFLHRLRCEESAAQPPHQPPLSPKTVTSTDSPSVFSKVEKVKPPPPTRKTGDDKQHCLHQQFVQSVDDAEKRIKQNEASLMKLCKLETSSGPALSQSEMMQKQRSLQHNLALAGVEVANLVAANYADKIDYTAASKSTKTLPQLMNSVVEDVTQLSDNVNELARKALLYDVLQLCGAAGGVCTAARSHRQKLNDAAVSFGDASTKLLYVVSNDVDPALEKEIISRAKAIGDSASRLALDAAGIATAASGTAAPSTAGSSVQKICDAGTACVDAAGKLVYTAKLTAPSIHEPPCQAALAGSADTLSAALRSFARSWVPLASDTHQTKTIADLTKEADNLERILDGLRSDVKGGRIGRRREMEQLLVEDTPMRQLTVKILNDAQTRAAAPELLAAEKIEYAAYADRLAEALRALDLANARCKRTPHDTNKRRELEGAIQNLQMILLQSRPRRDDKGKSNIVDLRDFIEEVSSEAKKMRSTAGGGTVSTAHDKKTLEEIKKKCEKIEAKASKVMNVDSRTDLDSTFNDILEVDQLGQECDDLINEINRNLKGMEDAKAKRLLLSKMLPLSESCNMLRFATKSGISTEACATLDSSLYDLDDIEARVIRSLVQDTASGVTLRSKQPLLSGDSPATINLCREVASSAMGVAAPTVTAYIANAASRTDIANPDDENKLLKHLYKLVHLLKTLTVTTSKRAATWQPCDGPEVASITEQIIQEIYNPESKFGFKDGETKHKILNESEIAKLLIPSAPKVLGEKKQQEDKLMQLSSKLSSMCGLVMQGVTSPEALDRSAHAAAAAAKELDGIARGVNITDHIQRKRVDEAAKEMSFATYNVLKTAENVCQDPNNTTLRRKLVVTCETLNKSIDKLVSSASSAGALAQSVGALSRDTALQLSCLAPRACAPTPFNDTCNLLTQQADNIYKIRNEQPMPRAEFMRELDHLGSAVRTSTECAAQCAYFIALSEKHKDIAKTGLVDVPQIQKSIESIQDSCMAIIGACQVEQAKEQKEDLQKRVQELSGALDKAHMLVRDGDVRRTLVRARSCVSDAAEELEADLTDNGDMDNITPKAVNLLEAVNRAHCMIEKCPLVPLVGDMSADTKAKCDEVIDHSKTLLSDTLALLKDVNATPEEEEILTWVTYSTSRKRLLDAYDALVKSVKKNGHRAGIYEKAPEEEQEEPKKKSYIEIQVDLANSWLKRPVCKPEAKAIGQQAVRNVVDMARQMSEDLKGSEREEIRNVITETEQLLCECGKKYDQEKNSALMDRVKELKKSIQRSVVTRVLEDFAEAEAALDLDALAEAETDESKRKFILERKIASLLAQLGRVTRTVRFVSGASSRPAVEPELTQCTEQTELLAPMLVQAAQQRIDHPDDKVVIEEYKSLLAQYAESMSKVRDLCDRAVDPMEFVQAAGDTMQRMREDMTQHNNDPQKCAYSSSVITKLANRVINVGMSCNAVQTDPELQKALVSAKQRLHAVTPAPHTRASRLPDWRESTAEILRTTGDVESALGGENIFKREASAGQQPIYSVARSLHESVREWSARDNEIVAVARRMAVLMARLSDYMQADKQQALITTSKAIVMESHEVAELAKKLAHECTDVRIKTNLLQTCERIPTISGQLKMLTTVKGSSLGHQGSDADKEAMDMLVVNAQSLMMSIQEVVKAAAGASVKIMSQRGPRLRWVRKNFY